MTYESVHSDWLCPCMAEPAAGGDPTRECGHPPHCFDGAIAIRDRVLNPAQGLVLALAVSLMLFWLPVSYLAARLLS
jgi:hypothetical protein